MTEHEGDPPIDAFLDSLSASNRRTLAAAGFDMVRLRELAATESGARQVRHIVTEFGAAPGPRAAVRRIAGPGLAELWTPARRVVAFWLLYLLAVAVVLALLTACVVLAGQLPALAVAAVGLCGVFLLWMRVPSAPWSGVAFLLTLPAVTALLATTLLYSPQWYLSARGRDVVATVEQPTSTWARGARVYTCRVRLPDGSVHGIRADSTCAHTAGLTRPVVYDPHDRVGPAFGHRGGLASTSRDTAAGLAAFTVLAAAGAIAGSARRKKGMR